MSRYHYPQACYLRQVIQPNVQNQVRDPSCVSGRDFPLGPHHPGQGLGTYMLSKYTWSWVDDFGELS